MKADVSEIMRKDISEKDNLTVKTESATLEYSHLSTNLKTTCHSISALSQRLLFA